MKAIRKATFPLLLMVFLIGAACNAPTMIDEVSAPPLETPTNPSPELSVTPFLPDAAGSPSGETAPPPPGQPLEPGEQEFTAEPAEDAAGATIPAPEDTQIFSAEKSLAPNTPESTQDPGAEVLAADPADFPTEVAVPGCDVEGNAAFEEILLNLINQERVNQGLNELVFEPRLVEIARRHSQDMACQNYFNHIGSDGSNSFTRIDAGGYPYLSAGENIYAGSGPYNCAQEAFKAWMKSAGHQEVMLHEDFEEVGIGYAFTPDSTYGGYFTAVFANR